MRCKSWQTKPKDSIITFVRKGEQCKASSKKFDKSGVLHEAKDWVMEVYIDQQLWFAEAICISTQRPDIVIYSLKLYYEKAFWKDILLWEFIKWLH